MVGAAVAAPALLSIRPARAEELKIGFVYVGPVGDYGFSYRHDIGRQAVEAHFGDRISTTYVESVKEGADAERVIRQLASSGHGLIFTTSFGFMNPTIKVAKRFPDVKFEHCTGYERADNVATYMGRWYEGRYIAGVIAGKMSKSGTIGYIGSFPIPEVVRGINAFTQGLHSVNPEARVKVVWASTWYDPGKEADAAKALIDQGADIILQHTDSPAPLQVAEQRGIFGVGQASDMIKFAPKAQLTAIIDTWDAYYIARTQAVLDGTWASADTWGGLGDKLVEMAPYTNMPAEVAALAKETEEKIASGSFHPFAGPVVDRDGKQRAAAGETLDDGTLLSMNWFVQGVEGSLPQ
jgi:simple sugar transport system substrate-binding protein